MSTNTNTNTNTNATASNGAPATGPNSPAAVQAQKAPMLTLQDFMGLAKDGEIDPALLAIFEKAQQAPSRPADDSEPEVYDATFFPSEDEARTAVCVRPRGASMHRAKCWITDAEALALIELADQVKAIIALPVERRCDTRPERAPQERKETTARASRTPAGRKETKAAKGKASKAKGKSAENPLAGMDLSTMAMFAKMMKAMGQ